MLYLSFASASLKVLLITTSNTWGLFLVILFLGYGLVEVPKAIFCAASPISRMRFGYFSLSKRYLEYIEDEEEFKTVLAVRFSTYCIYILLKSLSCVLKFV